MPMTPRYFVTVDLDGIVISDLESVTDWTTKSYTPAPPIYEVPEGQWQGVGALVRQRRETDGTFVPVLQPAHTASPLEDQLQDIETKIDTLLAK